MFAHMLRRVHCRREAQLARRLFSVHSRLVSDAPRMLCKVRCHRETRLEGSLTSCTRRWYQMLPHALSDALPLRSSVDWTSSSVHSAAVPGAPARFVTCVAIETYLMIKASFYVLYADLKSTRLASHMPCQREARLAESLSPCILRWHQVLPQALQGALPSRCTHW